MTAWIRHRFHANAEDYRPIMFPPPGPYWCTGYAGDESYATVVAYLPPDVPVTKYWPEAEAIDSQPQDRIIFTDRFARPDWWSGEGENLV